MREIDFTIYHTKKGVALRARTAKAVVWAREALPPSVVPRLTRHFTRRNGGILALGMIDPVTLIFALSDAGMNYEISSGVDD